MNEEALTAAAIVFGAPALKALVQRITSAKILADPKAISEIPQERWELYHMDVRFMRGAAVRAGTFQADIHWDTKLSVQLLKHVAGNLNPVKFTTR